MIRINLLPIKKQQQQKTSRRQLVLFVLLIVVEIGALYPLYNSKAEELDKIQAVNQKKEKEIKDLKEKVKDVDKLSKQKKQLEEQLAVLNELEEGRTGPVRVLDEFQRLLSEPRNAQERKHFKEELGWNINWDPRRLWLDSLKEKDGKFQLSGRAWTADDVAEILLRLTSSVYFDNVQLISSQQVENAKSEEKGDYRVEFSIKGELSYGFGSKEKEGKGS